MPVVEVISRKPRKRISPDVAPRLGKGDIAKRYGLPTKRVFNLYRQVDLILSVLTFGATLVCLITAASIYNNCGHSSGRNLFAFIFSLGLLGWEVLTFCVIFYTYNVVAKYIGDDVVITEKEHPKAEMAGRASSRAAMTALVLEIAGCIVSLVLLAGAIRSYFNPCDNRKLYTFLAGITLLVFVIRLMVSLYVTIWRVIYTIYMVTSFEASQTYFIDFQDFMQTPTMSGTATAEVVPSNAEGDIFDNMSPYWRSLYMHELQPRGLSKVD